MKTQKEFLKKLINALDEAKVPYMLSGSIASSFHGHPRATNDADIVIAPTEKQMNSLVAILEKDCYVSPQAARQAFKSTSMFNIIDNETSGKADFILCKDRAFSKEEFQRRRKANVMGLDIWIVSPEDIILTKLEWAKSYESKRQFGDALAVAAVQWDKLDKNYLLNWAKQLQVEENLKALFKHAEKIIDSGK